MTQHKINIPRLGYEVEFMNNVPTTANFQLPAQRHIMPARRQAAEILARVLNRKPEDFLSYAQIVPFLVYIEEEKDWNHVGWVVETFGV